MANNPKIYRDEYTRVSSLLLKEQQPVSPERLRELEKIYIEGGGIKTHASGDEEDRWSAGLDAFMDAIAGGLDFYGDVDNLPQQPVYQPDIDSHLKQ